MNSSPGEKRACSTDRSMIDPPGLLSLRLRNEYLYLTRDWTGLDWQRKRKQFTDSTSSVSLFLDMVSNIIYAVDDDELEERLIEERLHYFTVYSVTSGYC
ncbi:hypothetical protein PM082_015512 [Marasmius tenuissimus]|nr:hypothetical protein PM082_015512 [Marasmius tenuissimus]